MGESLSYPVAEVLLGIMNDLKVNYHPERRLFIALHCRQLSETTIIAARPDQDSPEAAKVRRFMSS
jgi:hypothetical protein